MAAFYSDKVMDHFTNPRNVGEIGNAKCGDKTDVKRGSCYGKGIIE